MTNILYFIYHPWLFLSHYPGIMMFWKRKKMFFSETIRLMWINLDINSSWVFLILIYQFVWILSKMAPVTGERKFLIGSKSPFLEPIFFPTWLRFPLDLSRFSFFFGGQFYTIVDSSWLWRWVILKVKIIKNLLLCQFEPILAGIILGWSPF
jgi:hypothetical protein